ncbi:MAG: RNA polymerase factor sigma-54 [candidate division WOR-3 bacterium]|nr:MAG: RNA polymerase factor sigma-54 [candidate division WOR-3 bacterium]
MRYDLGLTQKLSQELKLHPQLILNLQILQLATQDLEALIQKELQENPAMELADQGDEGAEASDSESGESSQESESEDGREDMVGELDTDDKPVEASTLDDYSLDDLMPDDAYLPDFTAGGTQSSETDAIELAVDPGPGLRDALLAELRTVLADEDKQIAEVIVENLDEDGFLTVAPEELAQTHGFDRQRVDDILYAMQRIHPGGIGCPGKREAFLVQLELHGSCPDSLEHRIVSDHWDSLLQSRLPRIAKLCGVSMDRLRQALEVIAGLEPRPARQFTGKVADYVSPDFSVVWRDDEPVPLFFRDGLPRLRLARRYADMIRNPKEYTKEQVAFAREKFHRAVMFLKGIESRRHLLEGLMHEIVRDQREFFLQGPQFLKPATMKDAANRLKVHPSTVSRAVAGKYVETDYGIHPLKFFFKAGAGDKSRASIKQRIKLIVEAEDTRKPLSDDQIRIRLKEEGIEISRRTVAKYRDELGIPGRNQRRGY